MSIGTDGIIAASNEGSKLGSKEGTKVKAQLHDKHPLHDKGNTN